MILRGHDDDDGDDDDDDDSRDYVEYCSMLTRTKIMLHQKLNANLKKKTVIRLYKYQKLKVILYYIDVGSIPSIVFVLREHRIRIRIERYSGVRAKLASEEKLATYLPRLYLQQNELLCDRL